VESQGLPGTVCKDRQCRRPRHGKGSNETGTRSTLWSFWAAASGPGPVQLLCQLALLIALHVAGLALFTRGFMLTRVELPVLGSCADYQDSQQSMPSLPSHPPSHESQDQQSQDSESQDIQSQDSESQGSGSKDAQPSQNTLQGLSAGSGRDTHTGEACVQDSPFDRVVIVIIDAARYRDAPLPGTCTYLYQAQKCTFTRYSNACPLTGSS